MTSGPPRTLPSPKASGGHGRTKANLHVARLPLHLSNSELLEIFRPWNALSAQIMMDPQTGASRGFGFVAFPTEQAGSSALAAIHNKPFQHPTTGDRLKLYIKPSHFSLTDPASPSPYVFVRNVPATIPVDDVLSTLAVEHGRVLHSQFRRDFRSAGRVIVMLECDSVVTAQRVIDRVHGQVIPQWHAEWVVMARFADSGAIEQWQNRMSGRASSAPGAKPSPLVVYRYDPYTPTGVCMLDTSSSSGSSRSRRSSGSE